MSEHPTSFSGLFPKKQEAAPVDCQTQGEHMTKDEALDLALEALEHLQPTALTSFYTIGARDKAITAIKQARALDKKAENARELGLDYEPVAWMDSTEYRADEAFKFAQTEDHTVPLYTTPPVQEPVTTLFGSLPVYDTPPVQEPVAWMSREDYDDYLEESKVTSATVYNYQLDIPLYTTPPVQEPVGTAGQLFSNTALERLDLRPSTNIYITPLPVATPHAAQRQWVGLTDEEINALDYSGTRIEFVRAIEAKLKELNT